MKSLHVAIGNKQSLRFISDEFIVLRSETGQQTLIFTSPDPRQAFLQLYWLLKDGRKIKHEAHNLLPAEEEGRSSVSRTRKFWLPRPNVTSWVFIFSSSRVIYIVLLGKSESVLLLDIKLAKTCIMWQFLGNLTVFWSIKAALFESFSMLVVWIWENKNIFICTTIKKDFKV